MNFFYNPWVRSGHGIPERTFKEVNFEQDHQPTKVCEKFTDNKPHDLRNIFSLHPSHPFILSI